MCLTVGGVISPPTVSCMHFARQYRAKWTLVRSQVSSSSLGHLVHQCSTCLTFLTSFFLYLKPAMWWERSRSVQCSMFKSASFNRPGQDRTDLDLVAFARLHCADNCPKAYRTYPTGRILCSHSNRSFSRVSSLLLPFFFSRSLPNERTNERIVRLGRRER